MTTESRPIVAADWADPYDFSARREWIKVFFLLLITAIAYTPVFSAGFLWRDDQTILANDSIRSLRAVGHTWLHPRSVPLYRPVADTLLSLEYSLWGSWNPTGYHIISLGLHLLATVLFWRVLVRLNVPAALVGAGLFALHPVAVQTVAWAAQQPVLLASVFALLSVLVWLRWREPLPSIEGEESSTRRRQLLLAAATLAFFVAALLSDVPTTLGLVLVMALIAWWRDRGIRDRRDERRLIALAGITVVIGIGFVCTRSLDVPPPSPFGQAIVMHLVRLLVPYPLLLEYAPMSVPWRVGLDVTLALWAAIAVALVLKRRLSRSSIAAFMYLGLLVGPVALNHSMTDAQQYLARAPLLALLAAALTPLIPEREEGDDARHRATRPIIGTILVILLAAGTFWQATFCRSNAIAWAHVLAHDPDSRIARLELGRDALARRDPAGAIEQFQQVINRDPFDADAQLRLGEVMMEQGNLDEASAHFEKAAQLRPDDPSAWRHRAAAAARKDDLAPAVTFYEKALALDPRDGVSRNNLATLYVRQGQIDRAIDAYTQVLKDNSRNAVAHVNLARLLFDTGKPTESAEHLKQAVAIDPGNFDAYMTAGDVLMKLKDFHQAQRMFQQAVHLRRENAPALNALGVSYAAQGLWNEAVFQFGRALDVDPDYAPAKKNLDSARRDRDAAATQPH